MALHFKQAIADQFIRKYLYAFFIMLILFVLIGVWKWSYLPAQLPLYYSLPRGPEQLGSPLQLLVLPLFALVFFLANFGSALYLFNRRPFAARLFVLLGTIASFLLLITYIKIVFLVT